MCSLVISLFSHDLTKQQCFNLVITYMCTVFTSAWFWVEYQYLFDYVIFMFFKDLLY